jgi:Ca-activated chloride channel family protein
VNSFHLSLFIFLVLLLTTSAPAQQPSVTGSAPVYRTVTVTDDRNRSISGLTQEQFSVSERKTRLDISYFESKGGPASVGFVLDLSASMDGRPQKLALEVADRIRRGIPQPSDYLIVAFNEKAQVICDVGCDELEAGRVLQSLAQITPHQNTALYDACDLALKRLAASKQARRVLIVFSDGADNSSKLTFSKLRESLRDSNVTLYAVGLHSGTDAGSMLSNEGDGILEELSTLSGGKAYFLKDKKTTDELAEVITAQFHQYYTIGFKPLDPTPDQKWHTIKIRLELPKTSDKPPHYDLRYRAGYYSR